MRPFAVSCILQAVFTDTKEPVGHSMESIRIFWAETLAIAERESVAVGKGLEHGYANMEGREVEWQLKGSRVFEVFAGSEVLQDVGNGKDGIEVLSRFLDDRCAELLLAPEKKT